MAVIEELMAFSEVEMMDMREVVVEMPLLGKRKHKEDEPSSSCAFATSNKRRKMECGVVAEKAVGEPDVQPLLSSKRRRKDSQTGWRSETHIDDLPDECLCLILERLHHADGSMRNMALRVASVCKRWANLMEIGVADIDLSGHLEARTNEEDDGECTSEEAEPSNAAVQVQYEQEQEQGEARLELIELPKQEQGKPQEYEAAGEEFLFGKGLKLAKDAVRMDGLLHSLHRLQGLKNLRISFFLTVENWDSLLTAVGANCRRLETFSLLDHLGTFTAAGLVNLAVGCRCLKELRLANGKMTEMPEEVFELRNLQTLTLSSWGGIRTLPPALANLTNLEELELINCWRLEDLSPAMGSLSSLRHLTMTGCDALRSLPATLGRLNSLEELSLADCFALHELPDSIGQLPKLQCFGLFRCTSLETLPDSFGRLVSLNHLDIAECSALHSLPESLSGLSNLERLRIVDCCRFANLPKNLGGMKSLHELEISFAGISSIPESIGELGTLRVLSLERCPGLTHLPDTLGLLSGLEELNLSMCEALKDLPETVGGMMGLQKLDIHQCKSITTLPSSMRRLTALKVCI